MVETYFTSDTHFGHKNILEYEKEARPFNTVEEMNEQLITNWNQAVRPKDIVFHLGDFAFGSKHIAIASRLNGDKRLVMGNHDSHSIHLYLFHFKRVFGAYYWRKCILTHIPVHHAHLSDRFLLNIHGHLHSRNVMIASNNLYEINTDIGPLLVRRPFDEYAIQDQKYFNVAVECHNLTPVHSSLIIDRLKEIEE